MSIFSHLDKSKISFYKNLRQCHFQYTHKFSFKTMCFCHSIDSYKTLNFWADLVQFHFMSCEISMSVTTDVSGYKFVVFSSQKCSKNVHVIKLCTNFLYKCKYTTKLCGILVVYFYTTCV